ncbi:GTP cyclohydrolase II RibA [Ensifer sp. NM-2]|uniref:GTP cyclohydrolase II RibA n=1 Tax=Ensifer sp. NM-2 TaxID=2109730 RepID=UPI00211042CD|nr:GTP cyclohydrolase II RibA [Ensifer sp. NM-2]
MDLDRISSLAYAARFSPPENWRPASPDLAIAADLAHLSLLLPAIIFASIEANALEFRDCATLCANDLEKARSTATLCFSQIARTSVPLSEVGACEFIVFRGGMAQRDQIAIIVGAPRMGGTVPVRIHSSCITGDLLGSLKCDCGDQLHESLRTLAQLGGGVLLYLDQEGRGTGIAAKLRAYASQGEGLDTIDADAELGFGPDERSYGAAVAMLSSLGIRRVNLLTNNPAKVEYLTNYGIQVVMTTSITGKFQAQNAKYLTTKAIRAGHTFPSEYLSSGEFHAGPRVKYYRKG